MQQQQPIEIDGGRYWTTEGVARHYDRTQRHIGLLIRSGKLQAVRLSDRVQLITHESVQTYFTKERRT